MAQFDESKVINALHTDKAEVGKKYYYSDQLLDLKYFVINGAPDTLSPKILTDVNAEDDDNYPFIFDDDIYQFIYPYEEPPKQRMTRIQLMEWLSKGNGMFKFKNSTARYTYYTFLERELNKEVREDIVIRTWDSEEWIEPTVDIYERDCKKE